MSKVPKYKRDGLKYLVPLISSLWNERGEKGDDYERLVRPVLELPRADTYYVLGWSFDLVYGRSQREGGAGPLPHISSPRCIPCCYPFNFHGGHCCDPKKHLTNVDFQALTQALFYLALLPEYLAPLREEVEETTNHEGWTKAALDKMHKIDSFIKESQRLHPPTNGKTC